MSDEVAALMKDPNQQAKVLRRSKSRLSPGPREVAVFLAVCGIFASAVLVQVGVLFQFQVPLTFLVMPLFLCVAFASVAAWAHLMYRTLRYERDNLRVAREEILTLNQRLEVKLERQGLRIEEVEAQLELAQSGTNVAALAAGLVHDINNSMMVVMHVVDELGMHAPDEFAQDLADAKSALELVRSLTRGFRSVVTGSGQQEAADLGRSVGLLKPFLERTLEPGHKLTVSCFPNTPASVELAVALEETQVNQILMNLVINARDAMRDKKGEIRLTYGLSKDGKEVMIQVSDEGVGMHPELQKRVFEPFFTTKASDKGSGLGLHILSSLVRRTGGAVSVNSKVEVGTTFRVSLPRVNMGPLV